MTSACKKCLWSLETKNALMSFSVFEMPNKIVTSILIAGLVGMVVEGKGCDTDGPQRCWMIDNGQVKLVFIFYLILCLYFDLI